MNKRLIGLTVGFALVAGIAIGDIAEPQISIFTDHILVTLSRDVVLHDVTVSIPKTDQVITNGAAWHLDYDPFFGSSPVMSYDNDPKSGVRLTVYLGESVPGVLGYGWNDITSVRVVRRSTAENISGSSNPEPRRSNLR